MKIRRLLRLGILGLATAGYLPTVFAGDSIAQSLQIYTHFTSIVGHPSWLLELRDVESGQVFPYLFDIKNNDNFWIAFSKEHSYRIVASQVKFGRFHEIHNFCNLEDGVLRGKSMFITLTGTIAPDRSRSSCHVEKYSDTHFIIVKPEDVAPPPPTQSNQSQNPAQLQNAIQSITSNPLVSGVIGQPKAASAPAPAAGGGAQGGAAAPAQAKSLATVQLPKS